MLEDLGFQDISFLCVVLVAKVTQDFFFLFVRKKYVCVESVTFIFQASRRHRESHAL